MMEVDDDEVLSQSIFRLIWSFVPYFALLTGVKNGLFDFVEERSSVQVKEVSERFGWKERETFVLLDLLSSLIVLNVENGKFSNSAATKRWLLSTSPSFIGPFVTRAEPLCRAYFEFEDVLQNGGPVCRMNQLMLDGFGGEKAETQTFFQAMEAMSTSIAETAVLKGSQTLGKTILDVGCGTAPLARAIARCSPESEFHFVDFPGVFEFLKRNFESFDKAKARFFGSDWFAWIGCVSYYDLIIFSHAHHEVSIEGFAVLMEKYCAYCKKDGYIWIIGYFKARSRAEEILQKSLAANMLVEMGSHNPTIEEISTVMRSFGILEKEVHSLGHSRGMWIGRKVND